MVDQWEYAFASGVRGDIEQELSMRGAQGWEAVGVGVEGTLYVVLLKRRQQAQDRVERALGQPPSVIDPP
jgi:hypothetical protein